MSEVVGAIAAACGLVMLAAAWSKVDGWRAWRRNTRGWFGHGRRAMAIRYGVPAAETTAGLAAVFAPAVGMAAVALLLVVLAAGVYQLSRSHGGEPCNCFGALMPSSLGRELVVRDLLAAIAAAVVAAAAWRSAAATASLDTLSLLLFMSVVAVAVGEYAQMRRHALERQAAAGTD